MSDEVKSELDEAAESFSQDTDLDIPISPGLEKAVRWLLVVAFKEGADWQKKQT